jgi:HEAT repeat protein
MAKLEKTGDNRREVYALVDQIARLGDEAEKMLIDLAFHPNNHIREFAIAELGNKKIRHAEEILIASLNDSIRRVRSAAILAVGQIQSIRAVDSLIRMLVQPLQNNNTFHIYGALGDIGDPKAIPVLAKGLDGGERYNQTAALDAIMRIDPGEGLKHAYAELNVKNVEVRRHAVITCIKTGKPEVADALKALFEDEDFEVRFYARQGIKRLKK